MTSLVVQSVLFGNEVSWIRRSVKALVASLEHAVAAGSLDSWVVRLGDCSPTAILDLGDLQDLVPANAAGQVEYVFFAENLGHGGGHNALAEVGDSELILFLNPDSIIAGTGIAELLIASQRPDFGVGDARQIPVSHPKAFDHVTGIQSWASGACLLIRREVFDQVGRFDHESFFLYGDDVDLSWRVRMTGLQAVHVPRAIVFHDKQIAPGGAIVPTPMEVYYSAEARFLLSHKYSRPDLVATLLHDSLVRNDPEELRARQEFLRRRDGGFLPLPIDRSHRVGQFIRGEYAHHRF